MSSFEIASWVTWKSLPILPSIFGLSSQNIVIPHYSCHSVCQKHLLSSWSFVELLWIPLQNSIGLDLLWEIDLPMKSFGTSVKFEWNPLYTGRVYGQCSGHHPGWRPDEGHCATPHCGPYFIISSKI